MWGCVCSPPASLEFIPRPPRRRGGVCAGPDRWCQAGVPLQRAETPGMPPFSLRDRSRDWGFPPPRAMLAAVSARIK